MVTKSATEWTCQHFSLSNGVGTHGADLPLLLRRLADHLSELGAVDVMDVALSNLITDGQDRWSATVYFTRADE